MESEPITVPAHLPEAGIAQVRHQLDVHRYAASTFGAFWQEGLP